MERERRAPLTLGAVVTFALLLPILFTGPLILGGARGWVQLPILEGVALLLLVQAGRIAFGPGIRPRLDLIDFTVLAFTLYAIARWLTSPTEYFSRLEILNIIGYATVFLTCRYGLARRWFGLVILGLLAVLGLFETGFGYYLSAHISWCPFGPDETLHQHYAPRWVGTYACPNHYGALLYMAMGAALALGAFSKLPWPLRIVCFYLAVTMVVGLIFAASRGSLLGMCGMILAFALFSVRYGMVRWWVPAVGAVVLLAGLAAVIAHTSLAAERMTEARQTLSGGSLQTYVRVVLARDALHIAHDYPWFGTGPATFVFVHPRYQDSTFQTRAVLTHDDYLNCLADYGLIGFALALTFVVSVTVAYFRRPRATARWQDRVLVIAGFSAWGGLLLHSFVDFNLHIPANAFMIFALTGLGLRRFSGEPESIGAGLPRVVTAAFLALFGLAFGYAVGRTGLSDLIYEHANAEVLDERPVELIAAANEAVKIDPHNVPALIFLGDEHRMEAAYHQDVEGRVKEGTLAAEAYQRARVLNPLDDTITASLGLTYDIMGRYPEAYLCLVDAVTHQPYEGHFWFRLGNHFWQVGLLEKAEQAYQMGLRCPHGAEENAEPAAQLRPYLEAQGIPLPAAGTNPLKSGPVVEHYTVP